MPNTARARLIETLELRLFDAFQQSGVGAGEAMNMSIGSFDHCSAPMLEALKLCDKDFFYERAQERLLDELTEDNQ